MNRADRITTGLRRNWPTQTRLYNRSFVGFMSRMQDLFFVFDGFEDLEAAFSFVFYVRLKEISKHLLKDMYFSPNIELILYSSLSNGNLF